MALIFPSIDFSTDSISLFGDMDQNELEEADENEEMVLRSLKGEV